jgi:hypothetical protein
MANFNNIGYEFMTLTCDLCKTNPGVEVVKLGTDNWKMVCEQCREEVKRDGRYPRSV